MERRRDGAKVRGYPPAQIFALSILIVSLAPSVVLSFSLALAPSP
jgi:hypothetical protein